MVGCILQHHDKKYWETFIDTLLELTSYTTMYKYSTTIKSPAIKMLQK